MSVLTFVFIGLFLYIFFVVKTGKNKLLSLLILTALTELMYMEGAFLNFGGSLINFKFVSMFAMFVYSLYFGVIYKIKINSKLLLLVFAIIIYCSFVTMYYNSYPPELVPGNAARDTDDPMKANILHVVKIIMFSYCLMIVKTVISADDLLTIMNKLIKYGRWLVYYVTFEFIANNVFHASSLIDFIQIVGWLRQAEWGIGRMRGDLYELRGLSAEPSHLCIALFSYCTILMIGYFYYRKQENEKGYKFIIGIIYSSLLMILSTGSSAYVFCAVLFCMYLVLRYFNFNSSKDILKFMMGVSFGILLCHIIFDYMIDTDTWLGLRLTNLTKTIEILSAGILYPDMNQVSDSSLQRFLTIIYSLIDFSNYPFTGIGLATSSAHDSVVTFLLDFGILGALLYFMLLFYSTNGQRYKKGFIFTYILLGGLLCGSRHIGYESLDLIVVELTWLLNEKNKEIRNYDE